MTHEIIDEVQHWRTCGTVAYWDTAVELPDGRVIECDVEYETTFTEVYDDENAYSTRYTAAVSGADIARVRLCLGGDGGGTEPLTLTAEELQALTSYLVGRLAS